MRYWDYSFYNDRGKWNVLIGEKSIKRIKKKSKAITARNIGTNITLKTAKMKPILEEWINYFLIAKHRYNRNTDIIILTNKPPYAKWHVQWCERLENKIGGNPD